MDAALGVGEGTDEDSDRGAVGFASGDFAGEADVDPLTIADGLAFGVGLGAAPETFVTSSSSRRLSSG